MQKRKLEGQDKIQINSRDGKHDFSKATPKAPINPMQIQTKGGRKKANRTGLSRWFSFSELAALAAISNGVNSAYSIARIYDIEDSTAYRACEGLYKGLMVNKEKMKGKVHFVDAFELTESGRTAVEIMKKYPDYPMFEEWVKFKLRQKEFSPIEGIQKEGSPKTSAFASADNGQTQESSPEQPFPKLNDGISLEGHLSTRALTVIRRINRCDFGTKDTPMLLDLKIALKTISREHKLPWDYALEYANNCGKTTQKEIIDFAASQGIRTIGNDFDVLSIRARKVLFRLDIRDKDSLAAFVGSNRDWEETISRQRPCGGKTEREISKFVRGLEILDIEQKEERPSPLWRLSSRAFGVLYALGVKDIASLEEFVEKNPDWRYQVLEQPNCGIKTLKEIDRFVDRLKSRNLVK